MRKQPSNEMRDEVGHVFGCDLLQVVTVTEKSKTR